MFAWERIIDAAAASDKFLLGKKISNKVKVDFWPFSGGEIKSTINNSSNTNKSNKISNNNISNINTNKSNRISSINNSSSTTTTTTTTTSLFQIQISVAVNKIFAAAATLNWYLSASIIIAPIRAVTDTGSDSEARAQYWIPLWKVTKALKYFQNLTRLKDWWKSLKIVHGFFGLKGTGLIFGSHYMRVLPWASLA